MQSRSLLAAVLALAAAETAQAQDEVQAYRPTSAWALDYGEDYCRLARTFSDGSDELALAIERNQPGAFARVVIVADGLRLFRRATEIGYAFEPSGTERTATLLRSQTPEGKQYLNLGLVLFGDAPAPGNPPAPPPPYDRAAEQAFASGIQAISLEDGLLKPVRIDTGELGNAIGALQACADDLLTYWGLDAEVQETLSSPVMPVGDASKWLPANTVGFEDFGKLAGGGNLVRVMVDAEGKPTECHVHWASLDETTNARICAAVMKNGTFAPARDQSGSAVKGMWMVPPFALLPPPPGGGPR